MRVLQTEVLVAGAGPCGLMLANELGRRGIRCLVLDPHPGTTSNPKANATQARTMEHFRRLGFADEIRALGLPADHPTDIVYLTRLAGHELARLRLPSAAEAAQAVRSSGGSWSCAELPHRVSQALVEACLRRHAEAWPTVDLRFGWQLEAFDETPDGVTALVRPVGSAAAVEVQARYLVGADGARSVVRSRLGIAWQGRTGIVRDFVGGAMLSVHLRAPGFGALAHHARAWMRVAVNAQRRAVLIAVDGASEFAFHASLRPGEESHRWSADDARRVFAEALGVELPIEVLAIGTWLAGHALVAQRFGCGRVFIAGDAAHLFTPTGGLGYNTGIEDAVNLGWKLAAVLRGSAPEALLASYEAERKPAALRNTAYARRFADSIGLFKAEPELDADTPAGQAERRRAGAYLDAHARLEFDIPGVTFGGRCDDSPVIAGDGSAAPPDEPNRYQPSACPGGRAPHAWLDDGRSTQDLFDEGFTLLRVGEAPPDAGPLLAAGRAAGMPIYEAVAREPVVLERYKQPLVLVRPDGHVAWRGAECLDNSAAIIDRARGA